MDGVAVETVLSCLVLFVVDIEVDVMLTDGGSRNGVVM